MRKKYEEASNIQKHKSTPIANDHDQSTPNSDVDDLDASAFAISDNSSPDFYVHH